MKKKEKYVYITLMAASVLFFIGITLTDFNNDIQDRVYDLQIQSMHNLSMQGSAVVEKNLEGMINTLYGLTEFLEADDLNSDQNMEKLRQFVEKRDTLFQRLGIADAQGHARITNGKSIDISNRTYFQECMKNKRAISEIRESDLINKLICVIAVPILKGEKEPAGILYGVIDIGVFRIYENTILEDERQYIQIIDTDGTYILKEPTSILGKKDNIFDGLSRVESQMSLQEIQKKIRNEEQVYTEITDGKSREIVYFTPLKLNHWCVVTVMDRKEITDSVDYILGYDVYAMISKVASGVLFLCMMIMYFSWKEKKQVEEFNEQLMFDEEIFRIASEKSRVIIMNYTLKNKQLRFMNNTLFDINLPDQIDNAPENFKKYIPDDKKLQKELQDIIDSMEKNTGKREFFISLSPSEEKNIFLKVQLTALTGAHGEIRQYIGVIEDITEEQQLRERADRDSLTGLYTRTFAEEQIETFLKNIKFKPGMVHACMIIDLDNFKALNDTLGHQMGDRALQDVAHILRQHFRDYDIVSRLGGDEFLIFIKDIPCSVIDRNINSLLKKLALSYGNKEQQIRITASAGLVMITEAGCCFQELYRKADKALYDVKHGNKNGFRIYGS